MKKLHSISLSRLVNLEFGQHIKSTHKNLIKLQSTNVITDAIFLQYLGKLEESSNEYDRAMVQIFKSDETAKIEAADLERDIAYTALLRYFSVYELSEVPEELLAYNSLKTLFDTYGDVRKMNFEKESNAIDNLIVDLNNSQYSPHVTRLNMVSFINRITNTNNEFKTLFEGRTQEQASKEVFDVKQLRRNAKEVYEDLVAYVLSMAKAVDSAEFNQSLDVINTVRSYYDNLLAKRKPAKKGEVQQVIPPME